MSTVFTSASVSVDGFISGPDESGFEHLFAWHHAGEVRLSSALESVEFELSSADHDYITGLVDRTGVLVVGRKLFDVTDGWGGTHPFDRPVVVVTHSVPDAWVASHPAAPFTFVTHGVAAAVGRAREIAGDRDIGVNGGRIASQCLDLGLLDEILVDVAPVLLGGGTPFFSGLGSAPILLDGPEVVPGEGVTHLRYRVRKG
jgi:dihydrofolate reductase